jgi:hypothetical protein
MPCLRKALLIRRNYLEVLACLRNRTGSVGSVSPKGRVEMNGEITLPGAGETVPQLG